MLQSAAAEICASRPECIVNRATIEVLHDRHSFDPQDTLAFARSALVDWRPLVFCQLAGRRLARPPLPLLPPS